MNTPEFYYGWLSLLPPLIVIALALITRLSLEPLIIGIVAGYVIIDVRSEENFFNATIDSF